MQIQSIQIKNFREFQDVVTLRPVYSEAKNVTLIRGTSGDEVDTLYQACRWCFWGEDAPDCEGRLLLNGDLGDELTEGETQNVQVEMGLYHQGVAYHILRTQEFIRTGSVLMSPPASLGVSSSRIEGSKTKFYR